MRCASDGLDGLMKLTSVGAKYDSAEQNRSLIQYMCYRHLVRASSMAFCKFMAQCTGFPEDEVLDEAVITGGKALDASTLTRCQSPQLSPVS